MSSTVELREFEAKFTSIVNRLTNTHTLMFRLLCYSGIPSRSLDKILFFLPHEWERKKMNGAKIVLRVLANARVIFPIVYEE